MAVRLEIDLQRWGDSVTDVAIDLGSDTQITIAQKVDANPAKYIELSVDDFLKIHTALIGAQELEVRVCGEEIV